MIDAADRAGVVLNVGHSHSYDEPYRAMRELIASGELGRVRMLHNIYYSDWVYRPRRPRSCDASPRRAASRSAKARINSTSCGCSAAAS